MSDEPYADDPDIELEAIEQIERILNALPDDTTRDIVLRHLMLRYRPLGSDDEMDDPADDIGE